MGNKYTAILLVAAMAVTLCARGNVALAGLSGPPPSFVLATRDGKHLLVMISPVPVSNDSGNDCTLPSGERVNLREYYAASGLYKIGSRVAIWNVDWYQEENLVCLSEDGRFAIRVNRFGGGGWGEGIKLGWGIKFYDAGVEIRSYDVAEFVDYPSLMEFTSSDWHYLWIDDSVYRTDVEGRFYVLKTSTRERYRFDVTTGAIVEEQRVWRSTARAAVAALLVIAVAVGALVLRRHKGRRNHVVEVLPPEDNRLELPRPVGRRSYRLLSLFVLTTGVAFYCAFPHIAILLSGLCLAVFCTRRLRATNGRLLGKSNEQTHRRRALWWSLTVGSWLLFYALSLAPAWGLTRCLDWPHDCQMVLLQVPYAPLYWLAVHTGALHWGPIELYCQAWGVL